MFSWPTFGYCYLFIDQLVMQEEFQLALFKNRKKENLFANRVNLKFLRPLLVNLKDESIEVLNSNALVCRYLICLMLKEKASLILETL